MSPIAACNDAKINKILFLPASDMVPESKTASTQPDALSY
ncbi:hypothetical protein BFJ63_vAg13574 [Fusarium oxysporum f. sp. narcissi]|uniref:Uncharacterized protein n=2 Tax=Fusarium oxysporum TaxID=5507 RepID=A0A420R1E6_FUSOX|nr:hypothetical protein BFJ68_g8519 [Fusarium oxysporum]RYC83529.1 hypothetical protein BFJ63_vAg13574 [Fusarium oxysporum f. sp. narcissi]